MAKKWQASSVTLMFRDQSGHIFKQTISHLTQEATEEDIKTLGLSLAKLGDNLTYAGAMQTDKDNLEG